MSSNTGYKTGGRMKVMLKCYSALSEIYFECSHHQHELHCRREVLVTLHIPGVTFKVGTVQHIILTWQVIVGHFWSLCSGILHFQVRSNLCFQSLSH